MEFNELVRKWPDMSDAEKVHHAQHLSASQYMELMARVKNAPNANADLLRRELAARVFKKLIV